MDIRGKTAIVTGASRGLGAALARQLAAAGARVVLVARGGEALEAVVAQIRQEGGDAHALSADVGDKQAVYGIAGTAAALVGPIDMLIHNASILGPVPLPLLLDTECEDLQQVLEVNLVGVFRLTKALLGSMVLRGQGLVVSVTSDAGVNAYPRWGAYGVSKAALDHLMRTFAVETEGTGVRFLTVDPGEMDTQMHADAMPEADRATLRDPAAVAGGVLRLIGKAEGLHSGARVPALLPDGGAT
jgi:NAD(P)-dependent dehydrogenase (short-subunit alcohol dehydrogenase family)